MKKLNISKLGKKLLFAMLSVCGGAALVACGTQVIPPENGQTTSINGNNNGGETNNNNGGETNNNNGGQTNDNGENTDVNNGGDSGETNNNGGNRETHNDNGGDIDDNTDDVETQIEKQLKFYEEHIESTIKEKLNAKLDENRVNAVDAKYFSFEQDSKYNTTFFVNGDITFDGDESVHSVNLGLPLDGDYFINISPLYYTDIIETNDLAQNYNVDELSVVSNYLDDENVTFSVAGLDGAKWDINALTSAQIEQNLEQKYEQLARQTFKNVGNSEYIQNVDFKFFTVEQEGAYVKLLKLCGNTANIFDDNILAFSVSFKLTDENYYKLKNQILTTTYDENADLQDNYTKSQLNEIVNIIDDDSTAIYKYTVDNCSYDAQIQERNM